MTAPTVLLVDDDADMRASLSMLVRATSPSATVHELSDGGRALAAIHRLKPDVVVTDLQMPNLGGRDFASMMNQLGRPVPFIVVSGMDDRTLAEVARLPNVVKVLRKPPDVVAFKDALAAALRSRAGAT